MVCDKVPNPNRRCSPLSFGVSPFSSIFPLILTIFLHFLSFFSYLFPVIPPFSSIFPLFSTIFLHFPWFFPPFSCRSQRLSFFPCLFPVIPPFSSIFPLFSTIFLHFPCFFPPFFLPESTDLGGIEAYRHLFA